MSQKYEKPLLQPFSSDDPKLGYGKPSCSVGGNADACPSGSNAFVTGCNPNGGKAAPTCSTGTTVTPS